MLRPSRGVVTFRSSSELIPYNTPARKQASNYDVTKPAHNMLSHDQSSKHTVSSPGEQSAWNASEISDLKSVLRKDFQAVDSRLLTSKKHYEDLNARFVAAEEEHTRVLDFMTSKLSSEDRMPALMAAKLLAEADGQELYARRLRESVTRIDQQKTHDRPQMLQLTATPDTMRHESDAAFELDAGHAATHMDESEASEGTVYADEGLQQNQAATEDQQPSSTRVSQVEDMQAHQIRPKDEAHWRPLAVAQLTPLSITSSNTETFSWEDLVRHLGGNQYSPGLYLSRNESPSRMLKGGTYWLLESHYEPFAPTILGQHGVKLTAFFNDTPTAQGDSLGEKDYTDMPVFVCLNPGEGYTYMGQYSQKRYSDKLSHSELFQHVPAHVLEYWAGQLAEPQRPAWITEQLIAHFWPPPPYTGPIPTDSALTSPRTGVTEPSDSEHVLEKRVWRALEKYALELRDWKKDAQMRATLLTKEALMETWAKSDMDEEKGLRLWWEYLECVGFDEEFYDKLVALKTAKQQATCKTASPPVVADISTYSGEVASMYGDKKHGKQRHDSVHSPTSTGTSTPKAPVLARVNRPEHVAVPGAFPQADLQAAREWHDKATKAGGKASDRKRGRSDKPQTLPPHARGAKW